MKLIKIVFIILTILSSILFFSYLAFCSSMDNSMPSGNSEFQLNLDIIDKIELVSDETITITNPKYIDEITLCFNKDVAIGSPLYDIMAIGGCGGCHWGVAFDLIFYSKNKSFTMHFPNECRSWNYWSKDFIQYDSNDLFKSMYMYFGKYFITEYDGYGLAKVLKKYNPKINM